MLKNGFIHQTTVKMIKRPLPIDKNKKKIVFFIFKDELGGKIMKEFVALRAKTYAYLMDDDGEKEKAKRIKKCVIKRRLIVKNGNCLLKNGIILKLQQRFKSDFHNVYTEQIKKIALSSHDDKRLQTCDKIIKYPYGTNPFKIRESELL